MRILFVLPILSHRGAERVAIHLAKGLHELGHHSELFFFSVSPHTPQDIHDLTIHTPNQFIKKILTNKYLYLLLSPTILLWYLFKCARSVDILHTESFPCLYPVCIVAKLYKKKVIWTIHARENTPPKNNIILKTYYALINILDHVFVRTVSDIICVSPKTEKQLQIAFPNTPIHMIIPPVNFTRLQNPTPNKIRQKYELHNRNIVLVVGILHPLKNQELALFTLKNIKNKLPNTTLILLGEGEKNNLIQACFELDLTYTDDITASTKDNSPSDVIFTSFVPDEEIKNYYRDTDLTLITSRSAHEGLGITGFESLYMGKMCITTSEAGIADIFQTEHFGIVTPPTPQDIAHHTIHYLQNKNAYTENIHKGQTYINQNLPIKAYAKKIERIYTS
jgi:glycosyltransferase involved in cell wall biosynthesis